MTNSFGAGNNVSFGLASLKPKDVIYIFHRGIAAYATGVKLENEWVCAKYMLWAPCKTGETMRWVDGQFPEDEIVGYRIASRKEADFAVQNIPQLRLLGKYVELNTGGGRISIGRISKAYRDALEMSPHIYTTTTGARAEGMPKMIFIPRPESGITINEITEDDFQDILREAKKDIGLQRGKKKPSK